MSILLLFAITITPAEELFQRANENYEQARYEEAIRLYDSALAFVKSAEVYFNRGNSYFKSGSLGKAMADYLRAWRLNPKDNDINYNLNFVRQFRPDKNPNPSSPLSRLFFNLFTPFNPFITRIITAFLFFLFALSLALYFLTLRRSFLFIGLGLGLIFLYCLGSVIYWRGATDPNIAVVVVPEAILRSGPGEEYKEIIAVHDGLEVKILESRAGFVLVQIPGGLGGWVENAAVDRVFQ
ncbi:MAG: tetratricopeptide repeat protein [candidate division WOR-3 bacterium]